MVITFPLVGYMLPLQANIVIKKEFCVSNCGIFKSTTRKNSLTIKRCIFAIQSNVSTTRKKNSIRKIICFDWWEIVVTDKVLCFH